MNVSLSSETLRHCSSQDTGPVTMTLVFRVHGEREPDFERALRSLQSSLREARGYLGTEVVHNGSRHEYTSILRFDSLECMNAWEASGKREAWQRELGDVLIGDAEVRYAHGLEFWFEAPQQTAVAPSKHKMALILFSMVTLISLPLSIFISTYLADLPRLPRVMFATAVQVGLLTYVVMPRVTRLLAFWLYPQPAPHKEKGSVVA